MILLLTPPSVFAKLVPWLVLFATALFAWGSFFRKAPKPGEQHLPPWGAAVVQFFIAVYGGYFGGGIGLLMMASLTMAGLAVRNAGASKNILAGVMNASAVAIFALSSDVHWLQAGVTAVGASFGGWAGALMLKTVNEKVLKDRRRRHRPRADRGALLEGGVSEAAALSFSSSAEGGATPTFDPGGRMGCGSPPHFADCTTVTRSLNRMTPSFPHPIRPSGPPSPLPEKEARCGALQPGRARSRAPCRPPVPCLFRPDKRPVLPVPDLLTSPVPRPLQPATGGLQVRQRS